MEPEGHPTQDLVEELQSRGAVLFGGTEAGPNPEPYMKTEPHTKNRRGIWLFLPPEVYKTGFDELPSET